MSCSHFIACCNVRLHKPESQLVVDKVADQLIADRAEFRELKVAVAVAIRLLHQLRCLLLHLQRIGGTDVGEQLECSEMAIAIDIQRGELHKVCGGGGGGGGSSQRGS